MSRRILLAGALIVPVLLLSGCATPEPSPTVTMQVTPAPAPTVTLNASRSGDSPLDEFDAWWFCRGEILEMMSGVRPPYDEISINEFDPTLVTNLGGGVFRLQMIGQAGDESISTAHCTVSGSVASPHLDDYNYPP